MIHQLQLVLSEYLLLPPVLGRAGDVVPDEQPGPLRMGVARAKAAVASNSNDLESIVNVVVLFGVGGESMRVCKSRS